MGGKMESNKRFLRYNSIAIVAWPILSVWLPSIISAYKKDTSLFSIESLMPMIISLTINSILAALPFTIFASLARLKIKNDKSDLLLKSLAFTFHFILAVVIISELILWFDNYTRTANGVNYGLVILLLVIYLGIIFLMKSIHSFIYKVLAKKNN